MNYRFVTTAFLLLVLLAIWSPSEELNLPSWVELARYAVFLSLSGIIIVSAYISHGLKIPKGLEAATLGVFFLYLTLSAFWGAQHADSYIKALLIINAGLTSMAIANTLGMERALRIIFAGLVTFMIACLVVIALFPQIGIDSSWEHAGKWKGLAGQKNGFGAICAFIFVAAVALPLKPRGSQSLRWLAFLGRMIVILLAVLCVYMAGSRGALLITTVGVLSLAMARAPKILQRLTLIAIVLLSLPILDVIASTIEVDADKIGVAGVVVDTNSRMKLWRYGVEQMAGRELVGLGLDSFWTDQRKLAFSDIYGWVLDNFHNGYITIFIEGGAIGLLLYLMAFLSLYMLLMVAIGAIRDTTLSLAFAYINMFAIINLVENEIGRSTSLLIFMFAILAFSLRAHVCRLIGREEDGGSRHIHPVSQPATIQI
jgi:exopolysaccharide production protein ExoQ